jgi:hypothetical protein
MPARVGIKLDELTPESPWHTPQFSAMNAPCRTLPAAIWLSVLVVQAIRVGVRNSGWGSVAGEESATIPSPRQIACLTIPLPLLGRADEVIE